MFNFDIPGAFTILAHINFILGIRIFSILKKALQDPIKKYINA
jgi:hypothetical protein